MGKHDKKKNNQTKLKKNDKKLQNFEQKQDEKPEVKEKSQKGLLWFLGVSAVSVALLLGCQFFFENTITGKERFYENTKINGIDVGGMSIAEAENVVLTNMLENRSDVEIELMRDGKSWKLSGSDFEVSNKIQPIVENIARYGKDGNFFQNMKKAKQIKTEGKDFQVSYTNVLSNVYEKIDEIVADVEQEYIPARLVFQPNESEIFKIDEGQKAILVNRDQLYQEIDNSMRQTKKVRIEIPIIEIENQIDIESLKNSVQKRSEFSTSYAASSDKRKANIKKAIAAFNGMIIEPGQTVSFNDTTGPRTEKEGYTDAKIIVGGIYVDGVGGGVCQVSTTLYNALLLADIDILSVAHHSLPASYVPLSFDSMVSGNYSDLVFKNNLEGPIYIKTSADDTNIFVEIFGQKFDDGTTVRRRAELVKILPHNGDKIVADIKSEYSDTILYKGEYLRIKHPREGYESKGFLQYYKNGELIKEKQIRHDFYQPQDGIVMEGVETPAEGMVIPASEVKIINPQKVTKMTEENIRNKLEKTNPSEFNP